MKTLKFEDNFNNGGEPLNIEFIKLEDLSKEECDNYLTDNYKLVSLDPGKIRPLTMIDENNNKSVTRERFFVVRTGYYPNGVKATATNHKSMTVFKSVYKQYEMYFNTPIFTPADMFEVKKTLIMIKKLVTNNY